uniref:Uncharacterized protein n=1 Tax=Arundo donax TaxID=35708 RepID=A0A0A9AYF4_ARUDO
MSSICTQAEVFSFIGPKSSAMNTGDLTASMHRCATTFSPATSKVTSAPSPPARRRPRCQSKSGGGTTTYLSSSSSSRISL